ncbi:MAG: DNA-methyltransferase [Gammaproteobacteria bacterium]
MKLAGGAANPSGKILSGDNLPHLKKMAAESVALVYIDPPFNTGKVQSRTRIRVSQDENGGRAGFGGKKYRAEVVGKSGYSDSFTDFAGFLRPRLLEAHRILKADGSLFFHIDWREAHRCRLLLEEIFGGPAHCINEIIWAYDFGARSKNRWSAKHDNIYWFAKNPKNYVFNYDEMDRIPYMAPDLAGAEKAARGKTPTDVWWNTIVPTNGREKTGYPTQKPLAIVERIVKIHSRPGDTVLDFFAGSGTTGEAAAKNGRGFILIDKNPEAIRVIKRRIAGFLSKKQKNGKKTGKAGLSNAKNSGGG